MEKETEKKPMIVLAGPTAVGKSSLSVRLAKAAGGEILSADSMQVYRHMDIGTAKLTKGQMQGVPHHMLDIIDPWEPFHAAAFQQRSRECLAGIYERGRIPIVTGGTGFYIQALLKEVDFAKEQEDTAYRHWLEELAEKRGPAYLHGLLRLVDLPSAQAIHPNNQKRVLRALAFYHATGSPISAHNERERQKERAYRSCYFVLTDDRHRLYQRIDERVDEMLSQGLLEEVKKLRRMGCTRDMASMQGLGYKELLAFLEGEGSYEQAAAAVKQNTRHFAKRQLTWFRREKDVIWVDKSAFGWDEDKILAYLLAQLHERGILGQGISPAPDSARP